MAPLGSGRTCLTFSECPWLLRSIHSDWCSIAKDRFWFGDDYTPFVSSVRGIVDDVLQVVGVGTVNLPTKVSPTESGPSSDRTLQLKNVLHVPQIFCNIIAGPALECCYTVEFKVPKDTSGSSATISQSDGLVVAYLKPVAQNAALLQVQLSKIPFDPQFRPLLFGPCAANSIHAFWSMEERRRFANFQYSGPTPNMSSRTITPNRAIRLNKRFCRYYGLDHDQQNEDEASGRDILQILMSDSNDEEAI